MSLRITAATVDDAPVLRQVMLEAYAEHRDVLHPPSSSHQESVEDVVAAIRSGGAILAWLDGTAVGGARYEPRQGYLYVGRVAVLPTHRRRGIASAMMIHLEAVARSHAFPEIRLGVRASLPSNLALYRSLGYETIAIEPHPRGPDVIHTMAKVIPS